MRLAVIAVAMLAGCVLTPKEVMEEGERSVHSLKRTPEAAAGCMARNIENARHYQTTVRDVDGMREIVARSAQHNLVVAQIAPDAAGSRATVWTRPVFSDRAAFVAEAVAGC